MQWRKEIGELLFPPRCVICGVFEKDVADGLCATCLASVAYTCSPQCVVCGKNFKAAPTEDHLCEECLRCPPPYTMARGITFYEEPVRTLLHRLKYDFDTTVVEPLLKIAGNYDFSVFNSSDYIVPVPLHSKRLKKRGFNQALLLAKLLFPQRARNIVVDNLMKNRNTISQTALDASARRANLRSAFLTKHAGIFRNKRICIVDDVYTTGTTVAECARTLKRAGADNVVVLTFARVQEKYI